MFIAVCLSFMGSAAFAQTKNTSVIAGYGTGNWEADSLGNHRAVVKVNKRSDVVWAHIPWRRRDHDPGKKGILIFDASTGKQIKDVLPVNINNEYGDILFRPETVPGEYYVYFMKYVVSGHKNYPTVTYPGFLSVAEKSWIKEAEKKAEKLKKVRKADFVQMQSVNEFNSFYPMEVIATQDEVKKLISEHPGRDFLLFGEDRTRSIRMDRIPAVWVYNDKVDKYTGDALRNEYYTFQIGVYPVKQDLKNIKVSFSDLKNEKGDLIPSTEFTCFNTEGTDWEGNRFEKTVDVRSGKVQALWIGVKIPADARPGLYKGVVTVKPGEGKAEEVKVSIDVKDEVMEASGDNDPYRMTRLRWLNSTLDADDGIVAPYTPLEVEGNTVSCLGREVEFGNNGLPQQIKSYFSPGNLYITKSAKDILAGPVRFLVETQDGMQEWNADSFEIVKQKEGAVAWKLTGSMPGFDITGDVQMEFDGNIDYKLVLTAVKDMTIKDIRLEVPMKQESAKYMMGLGKKGGFRPEKYDWKWAVKKNQDGPWLGDVNGGLQVRFRDDHYSRPLNTNFYQKKPLYMPDSWYNDGKGGITIAPAETDEILVNSYSGERTVKKGEKLYYYFNFLITPFHTLETAKHWHNRYYHKYVPVDSVIKYGADVINVHHATDINPYINYPFLRPDAMKEYVDEAHSKGVKVKIYYTVRELTNHAPEIFALRSLGDEIFSTGKGGGYSWLQEHLDSNYIAAWFVPQLKDAAIINRGISRWHNFYIEGLNWLVKNIGIDGVYIDDLAFDRTSMKRIRKVLLRGNPGGLIDLHSANQFNPRDGYANSANLYLENLPYIDRLWFGEYFEYNLSPDYWLVEVSGIPFGLMGEMLQDGGNPWRGMVYGMTARAPWSGDPAPLWKVWDEFGIQDSKMTGYWVPDCPVTTGNENVKATVYVKEGRSLISLGNWSDNDEKVTLDINWEKLGLNKNSAKLHAPFIRNFQEDTIFRVDEPVTVPGGKGLLLILE